MPPKPWENAETTLPDPPSIPTRLSPQTATYTNQYPTTNTGIYGNSTYGSNPYSYSGGMYGSSGYGSTGYGGTGYGSTGYGGSYGAGYGSYNSTYSSPYNRMSPYNRGIGGGGMYNRMGYPNQMDGEQIPLTQQVEQSTQQAFFVLDQIVQAFGGFSQMLDSTFHATHSSFMAMVGVAEQFGHLRQYLGQILSIFTLIKWFKRIFGLSPSSLPLVDSFQEFIDDGKKVNKPKGSTRPLWIFAGLLVGLPFLMSRLIKHLQRNKVGDGSLKNQFLSQQQNTQLPPPTQTQPIQFCKAIYDFTAELPTELSLKTGDIVAIVQKINGDWWKGRTREGAVGVFPATYVKVIESEKKSENETRMIERKGLDEKVDSKIDF